MPALILLLIPPTVWLAYVAGQAKKRREGREPIAPVVLGTSEGGGLYMGDQLLNSDWGSAYKRSYAVLKYSTTLGYHWSPVFVADPFVARSRVMDARLRGDGWLFTYSNGNGWIRVVGR